MENTIRAGEKRSEMTAARSESGEDDAPSVTSITTVASDCARVSCDVTGVGGQRARASEGGGGGGGGDHTAHRRRLPAAVPRGITLHYIYIHNYITL